MKPTPAIGTEEAVEVGAEAPSSSKLEANILQKFTRVTLDALANAFFAA